MLLMFCMKQSLLITRCLASFWLMSDITLSCYFLFNFSNTLIINYFVLVLIPKCSKSHIHRNKIEHLFSECFLYNRLWWDILWYKASSVCLSRILQPSTIDLHDKRKSRSVVIRSRSYCHIVGRYRMNH